MKTVIAALIVNAILAISTLARTGTVLEHSISDNEQGIILMNNVTGLPQPAVIKGLGVNIDVGDRVEIEDPASKPAGELPEVTTKL